jgi:spore coat polysaccharide biosynthesis protein SpsF (cytidylyltransferase family)
MVQFLLERLQRTQLGGSIIFATTERADDDLLAEHVARLGVPVFRGADGDVAGRFLSAAKQYGLDWIVRVTGDCPFVDAASLDFCLSQWDRAERCDMISTKGVFPVGIDYELFSVATLEREWPKMSDEEKEHLTLRFYRPELGFVVRRFTRPVVWPSVGKTYLVDTQSDYTKAAAWVNALGDRHFSVLDLLALPDG